MYAWVWIFRNAQGATTEDANGTLRSTQCYCSPVLGGHKKSLPPGFPLQSIRLSPLALHACCGAWASVWGGQDITPAGQKRSVKVWIWSVTFSSGFLSSRWQPLLTCRCKQTPCTVKTAFHPVSVVLVACFFTRACCWFFFFYELHGSEFNKQ